MRLPPISFKPIFMPRVWGGRRLESSLSKPLPPGSEPIGESWEIVDRPEAQSIVQGGPLDGLTLHDLWTTHRSAVFGQAAPESPRFPLLFKLLDARERLSLQVHPPAHAAQALGGEPKTEMWYILENDGGEGIFAGLRHGVSRAALQAAIESGSADSAVHRIPVAAGDFIFIPSGRIHAIGAGNLIVEVQQNSDTTYRVFDWGRSGLDGKPRQLHLPESLRSIDFADFEPSLQQPSGESLVHCPHFHVERWTLTTPREAAPPGAFAIFTLLSGSVQSSGRTFQPGDFFLIPASLDDRSLHPLGGPATLLRTTLPA